MRVTASVLPGIAVATKTQVYVPNDRYGSLRERERETVPALKYNNRRQLCAGRGSVAFDTRAKLNAGLPFISDRDNSFVPRVCFSIKISELIA